MGEDRFFGSNLYRIFSYVLVLGWFTHTCFRFRLAAILASSSPHYSTITANRRDGLSAQRSTFITKATTQTEGRTVSTQEMITTGSRVCNRAIPLCTLLVPSARVFCSMFSSLFFLASPCSLSRYHFVYFFVGLPEKPIINGASKLVALPEQPNPLPPSLPAPFHPAGTSLFTTYHTSVHRYITHHKSLTNS